EPPVVAPAVLPVAASPLPPPVLPPAVPPVLAVFARPPVPVLPVEIPPTFPPSEVCLVLPPNRSSGGPTGSVFPRMALHPPIAPPSDPMIPAIATQRLDRRASIVDILACFSISVRVFPKVERGRTGCAPIQHREERAISRGRFAL